MPNLNFVTAEDIVLLSAWALGATQAADQQDRHPRSHNQGKETSTRNEPLNQCMHKRLLAWGASLSVQMRSRAWNAVCLSNRELGTWRSV